MASDFERLYQQTRTQLLLQTWALTGDLRGAKNSVRDAFIHAAHHWSKVGRLQDPEPWLRSHAWQAAQRRQVTRLWTRDRQTSPEIRATLAALGRLTTNQRKLLILNHLTASSLPEMAREVGLTREAAERELQLAESGFAIRREVPSTAIRSLLNEPRETAADVRWPRAPLVWRAGAGRRRLHTGAGIAVTVAAVVLAGNAFAGNERIVSTLHDPAEANSATAPTPSGPGAPPPDTPRIADDAMLRLDAVRRLADHRGWHLQSSGPLTTGSASLPCRAAPAADRTLAAGLVREFTTKPGNPFVKAYELVEQSRSTTAAQDAYDTTVGWYAACADPHVQLLSAARVARVGSESTLLTLRKWADPVRTWTVGIARSGTMVVSTLVTSSAERQPGPHHVAGLLADAVRGVCSQPDAGSCPGTPQVVATALPPVGATPGMLSVVDLPPVQGIKQAWAPTDPEVAQVNPAATSCDATQFSKPITHAMTRSFLIPQAGLPARFGLSETVGTLLKRKARAWVNRVRAQLAGCPDRQLATTVTRLQSRESSGKRGRDLTTWHLTTKISDTDTVEIYLAVLRDNTAIGELSFIPSPAHTMAPGAFDALAQRALDRLAAMPRP